MSFILFSTGSNIDIIPKLTPIMDKLKLCFVIDAKHDDQKYCKDYANSKCYKFYLENGEITSYNYYESDSDSWFMPDMMIWNVVDVTDEIWLDINAWLNDCIEGNIQPCKYLPERTDVYLEDKSTVVYEEVLDLKEPVTFKKEPYKCRFERLCDYTVYEVHQPNTDRPYVTYVKNAGKKDYDTHYEFCTNLFQSSTWGSPNDIEYLKFLWLRWEMEKVYGEFDIDTMHKERVEKLKAGEEYPRVYRKSLEEITEMLEKKYF